jgi:hypothetical protein
MLGRLCPRLDGLNADVIENAVHFTMSGVSATTPAGA